MIEWLILILLIAIALLASMTLEWEVNTFMWLVIFIGIGWSMWHWRDTPAEAAAKEQQAIEQRQSQERPVKVSEIDGCSVYKFYQFADSRYHWFTNCKNSVTTDSNYKSGKTNKSESIVTTKE